MSKYTSTRTSSSLLQDNSWIRKTDEEDEDIDRDPNFAKSVLSQYRSSEDLVSSPTEDNTTKPVRTSTTSVQALTKRFSGSQDELRSSTLPSSKTTSSYTKSTYSSVKSDSPKTTTTTTVTKDGTTETTTTTTSQTLRSPVIKSPTLAETFSERVKASSKGAQYTTYSPTKTTKVTETTVTSNKEPEDHLYDTLIPVSVKASSPTDSKTAVTTTETVTVKSSYDAGDKLYDTLLPSSIKGDYSPTDSKTTITSTETVTVKSSADDDGYKTTTTTRASSTAEDDLYDTLLPKSITSSLSSSVRGESPTLSSPSSTRRTTSYSSYTEDIPSTRTTSYTISTTPSEDYSSERKSYSYSRPDSSYEYSSSSSSSTYTKSPYRSSSRSDDTLTDTLYSTSSMKSLYGSSDRLVSEKDLCTYCRKPFTGDAKMVLDDLKINCHATCFKCQVCNSTLSHLKAGDSMWVYRNAVHCENCFELTRDKWRR